MNLFKILHSDHKRTAKAKRHILGSLLVKGASIIIGFLLVRVALDYLDQSRYGVWLTLASFVTWFSFFEIGLGNGLRNKLAEALAHKDMLKGKIYVSTTYAILIIIIFFAAVIFVAINHFLDWALILNVDVGYREELSTIALIVFSFFFIRFIVKIISTILLADQRPAIANALSPTANFFSLLIIYYLSVNHKDGSLLYLSTVLSASPVIIMVLTSIWLYTGKYREIAPSAKWIRLEYAKDLMSLGVRFFVIQISGLIMFQSTNIIIAQLFGPAEVTVYNVAFKLFSVVTMVFAIIVSPFWSAITDAWAVKDMNWIKSSIKNLMQVWLFMNIGSLVLLFFSPYLFEFWLDGKVQVPFLLSVLLVVYFMLTNFGTIYNTFINGIGKITLQLWSALFGAVLFFPLAFLLVRYFDMGIEGLVIATICTNIYGPVLAPIQYRRIITNRATGIWAR